MNNTTKSNEKLEKNPNAADRRGGNPEGGSPRRPQRSQGLSTYHVSPAERAVFRKNRQARAIIYSGGSLMKVEGGSRRTWDNHPGIRGKVKGFSFASRRRLMRVIAKIPRKILPLFITLTYPGEFSKNDRVWKRNIDVFGKRWMREFPGSFIVWKLELQERGAPDIHLLVWGVKLTRKLIDWVSLNWYEVVGSGDLRHFRAGTRCEKIDSQRGAFAYVSKYTTKMERPEYQDMGRAWGIIGRENYNSKVVRPFVIEISAIDAAELLRDMSQMIGASDHDFDALTILCDAEWWYLSLDCFHERGRRYSIGSPSLVV